MTAPTASAATLEPTAESWRNNLRGDLAPSSPVSPRLVVDGKDASGLPRPSAGRHADFVAAAESIDLHPPAGAGLLRQWLDIDRSAVLGLKGEKPFRPPYHLRHPMIFYYGHPPTLYINKLRVAGLIDQALNPYYERLFETGVDEMRWDDMSKNEMRWPSIQEVHAYRRRVYRIVRRLIETHPGLETGHPPITQDHPLWALFMGFEHGASIWKPPPC